MKLVIKIKICKTRDKTLNSAYFDKKNYVFRMFLEYKLHIFDN